MSDELPVADTGELPPIDYSTLQRLFDEDPLKLTDQDYDHIIAELRKGRANYIATGAKTTQGKKVAKSKEIDQAAADLLNDLGL
jgi:hypothetical protein